MKSLLGKFLTFIACAIVVVVGIQSLALLLIFYSDSLTVDGATSAVLIASLLLAWGMWEIRKWKNSKGAVVIITLLFVAFMMVTSRYVYTRTVPSGYMLIGPYKMAHYPGDKIVLNPVTAMSLLRNHHFIREEFSTRVDVEKVVCKDGTFRMGFAVEVKLDMAKARERIAVFSGQEELGILVAKNVQSLVVSSARDLSAGELVNFLKRSEVLVFTRFPATFRVTGVTLTAL